jgi:hypothetical protein
MNNQRRRAGLRGSHQAGENLNHFSINNQVIQHQKNSLERISH